MSIMYVGAHTAVEVEDDSQGIDHIDRLMPAISLGIVTAAAAVATIVSWLG